MDKKISMTVAVAFLLLIITMTIRAQVSSIEHSAELSQDRVAHTTRSAATILHVRDSGDDYGKIKRDEFQDLMYNCGGSSGLAALNEDIRVAGVDNFDSCADATYVYDHWDENGLFAGIVVVEEDGEEQLEWMVVG